MSSSNTSSLWDFGNSGRKKCQVRQLTDTTIQRWELPLSILKERLLGKFLFDISEVFNLFDPWDFNRFSRRRCRRSWPIVQGSAFLMATWLRFNLVSRSLASHNRHEAWLLTCDGLDVLNFGPFWTQASSHGPAFDSTLHLMLSLRFWPHLTVLFTARGTEVPLDTAVRGFSLGGL